MEGYHALEGVICLLPDLKVLDNALTQWPEDIGSLLDDDPQNRREAWSHLAFAFPEGFPEAEYLIPAVEKAISAVPPEDIAEYTPPPYPTAPPQVTPLPDQKEGLKWLLEQFDQYLHDLQRELAKRKGALFKLVDVAGGRKWTEDHRKRVFELERKVDQSLPKMPDRLSRYVDFAERAKLDAECQDAIAELAFFLQERGDYEKDALASISKHAGTVTQAFERIDSFFQREQNRILVRLAEVERRQAARVAETARKTGGGHGTATGADDSGLEVEKELAAKVEKLRSMRTRPSWIEAYVSYSLALALGELPTKHTQDEAYALIEKRELYEVLGAKPANERYGLRFGRIPKKDNWKDYNRGARKQLGELKNSPRADRGYRVKADDIDRDSGKEKSRSKKKLSHETLRQGQLTRIKDQLGNVLMANADGRDTDKAWKSIVRGLNELV